MKKNETYNLLQKYNEGLATKQEQATVESWHLHFPLHEREVLDKNKTKKDLDEVRNNLLKLSGGAKVKYLWYRYAAAAVLFIICSLGLYLYVNTQLIGRSVSEIALNDIEAGRDGATLTLSDGSKINLSKFGAGSIARQSGISVKKTEAGEIIYTIDNPSASPSVDDKSTNTLSTSNGQQFRVNLPDGTKVWLNASSSLTYAPSFTGNPERRVVLHGEAYFEVAKDKMHPFIVKTDLQEVKVLGTHFNINSYNDEPNESTTLLEGSVNINRTAILRPGEMSTVSKDAKIKISVADTDGAVAWMNGYFQFDNVPLPIILRQVSRWYNIKIEYEGIPSNEPFNGVIDRKVSLSKILSILEKGGAKFTLKGNTLFVRS